MLRRALAFTLAFGLVAEAASAATLTSNARCYRPGQAVVFTGLGYTPNAQIALSPNTTPPVVPTANAVGAFTARLRAPRQFRGERRYDFTATDTANPGNVGTTSLTVSALDVSVRPSSARPGRRLRVGARGFMGFRTLYAHLVRGRFRRNLRVGRIRGACGKARARKALLPRDARAGRYLVQFDGRRRYSRRTRVRVRYRVTVFRVFRSSASSGSTWTLAD